MQRTISVKYSRMQVNISCVTISAINRRLNGVSFEKNEWWISERKKEES